ncbi:MAG TPA: sensor histidine kinase, partial [Caldimonas sp.]
MARWSRRLAIAILALLGAVTAAAADGPQLVIEHALAASAAEGQLPAAGSLVDVPLPDHWAQSRPGYSGAVWYRAGFRLSGAIPDELLAIYVE